MAVFMIERQFAEQLDLSADDLRTLTAINDDEQVRWLYSFLSVDKRKTYCLYDAPDAEAIRRAATRAGIPADTVIEVDAKLLPDGSAVAV